MFAEMSDSCCKTLFFPPGAGARLPMDMDMDGEYVQRLRNFVGNRNTLLFNGADSKIIAFINHYFGYKIQQVDSSPCSRDSGFQIQPVMFVFIVNPSSADCVLGRFRSCQASSAASHSWCSAIRPPRRPSQRRMP
jgi:hypothetical protein